MISVSELSSLKIFSNANPNDNSPLSLNESMFIPTIEKQGTEEQRVKWLPLARSYKIIGTYGQTELGHGK